MSINFDKPLQTRDGRKVRIYARDGARGREIHGAYWGATTHCPGGGWIDCAWELDGNSVYGSNYGSGDGYTLVNTPAPTLNQAYTLTAKDVYGDKLPELPVGYRFKIEYGQPAFRVAQEGEYFVANTGGAILRTCKYLIPYFILEPETTK